MAAGGVSKSFLSREDFELPSINIVDRPGGPEVALVPFGRRDIVPLRRNDPEWIARYTPVLERMNRVLTANNNRERRSPFRMKVLELNRLLKDLRAEHGPVFRAQEATNTPAVMDSVRDIYRTFGEAVHTIDPHLSYLLLYVLLNNAGLDEYDATIARSEDLRALSKEKKAERRSSVGDAVEMSADDINLPHGVNYHLETRKRAMTLAERTRLAQEEAGYAVGRPVPSLPAPHVSDAGTVRHSGPAGAGGGGAGGGADDAGDEGEMSGSGIPRSRGDQWHMGQNRMRGGSTILERGFAAEVRELHPLATRDQRGADSRVGKFNLLLNQVVHDKTTTPFDRDAMRFIKSTVRNHRLEDFGRAPAVPTELLEDNEENNKRVRALLPGIRSPQKAQRIAQGSAPIPAASDKADDPPQDENQAPLAGRGRGDQWHMGQNRRYV